MRLTLVIASLGAGGAERVMSLLASGWAARGWDVTVLTLASASGDFYALDARVKRVRLDLAAASRNPLEGLRRNARRLSALRQAIRASRPEAVISFVDQMNVLTLFGTRGLGVPVIVSERVAPEHHQIGGAWRLLRRLAYPRASALVVQSKAARRWAEALVPAARVHAIPNPVEVPPEMRGAALSRDGKKRDSGGQGREGRTVIAMGRLARQKGFDMLLDAFARVAPRHPEWRLAIIGEGEEREGLSARAEALGIADRLDLPGRLAQPFGALAKADVFVLSSRHEGFPNALLEAMALGLPAVSFDCPNGPGEIITDGTDGVLVEPENTGALAAALERLMTDGAERERLGRSAVEAARRFGRSS